MYKLLVLIAFFVVIPAEFSGAGATLFTPCGGSTTQVSINIQGCEDGVNDHCVFIRGNTYGFTVTGMSNTSALSLNTTVRIMCCPIFVPLLDVDVCQDLQVGECPIELNERFVFDQTLINVTNTFPQIQAEMKIETQNENKEVLICGRFKFAIIHAN